MVQYRRGAGARERPYIPRPRGKKDDSCPNCGSPAFGTRMASAKLATVIISLAVAVGLNALDGRSRLKGIETTLQQRRKKWLDIPKSIVSEAKTTMA